MWKEILGKSDKEGGVGKDILERVGGEGRRWRLMRGSSMGLGSEGDEGVKKRVMGAVGRLVGAGGDNDENGEGRAVLGCVGMAGMEEWVREEVERKGETVRIADGV